MSIWDYVFDHEWRQRADIEKLKAAQSIRHRQQARSRGRTANRLEELEGEVGELALLCRALLSVLEESAVVDPDAIAAAVHRIDAEDGVVDGRVTPPRKQPGAREAPQPGRRPKRR